MNYKEPKIIEGKPASGGIGIGRCRVLEGEKKIVQPQKIEESEVESNIREFKKAKKHLEEDFRELIKISDDEEAQKIIEAQIQTLNDPELDNNIESKVRNEHFSARYAVFRSFNEFIELLELTDTEWVLDRTIDLSSIRDQFVKYLDNEKEKISVAEGDIVFAEEISPTAMVRISGIKVEGIVLQKAGPTSHAVILSQSLGIPCIIGAHWRKSRLKNGIEVIIDGSEGKVILSPDENHLTEYKSRKISQLKDQKNRLKWAHKPSETKCGERFSIRANVEFVEELPKLPTHGAEGVGLLRTETILFQSEQFAVSEQVDFYSKVLEATGDEPVTIRLFDAGGDKLLSDFESETNPFLGWRGIRMLLDNEDLLRKQIEAIYRVSGKYPDRVKLLVPMVIGIEEIEQVQACCKKVEKNLTDQGVQFDKNIPFGVMIEVPSTVLMAESIGKIVDFFSIGTNDLTQYTLAVDRGNDKIAHLFDSFHPAIWKFIKMTVEAAEKTGTPVAVCGEMASKPEAASCLLGMGITDLSMNTGAIPKTKSILCSRSLKEMQALAKKVLQSKKAVDVHEILKDWLQER